MKKAAKAPLKLFKVTLKDTPKILLSFYYVWALSKARARKLVLVKFKGWKRRCAEKAMDPVEEISSKEARVIAELTHVVGGD